MASEIQPALSTDVTATPPTPPKPGSGPRVRCGICHALFSQLSDAHLRTHGYTKENYRRVFSLPTSPHPAARWEARRGGTDPLAEAAAIVAQPSFQASVADAILAGPLRDRLALSVAALLEVRSRIHGDAVARLERINNELNEEWRIKHGGPNGRETPTKDLLAMAQTAQSEVRATEELFLRTAKLAVDEMKGKDPATANLPDGLDRFTGAGEKLPIPTDISASERETVRQMIAALPELIARRRARGKPPIDVTPIPTAPAQENRMGSSVEMPSFPTINIGSSAPQATPIQAPPILSTTPMREADEPF